MDWISEINVAIDVCKSPQQLYDAISHIWAYRKCLGVWEEAVATWRRHARRLGVTVGEVVVACAPSTIEEARDIYSETRPDVFMPMFYSQCDLCDKLSSQAVQICDNIVDTMASLSLQCQVSQKKCILVSNDRRLWQVMGTGTTLVQHGEYRNADWLLATHKIRPQQAVDWLCLQDISPGEESDLLEAYGSAIDAPVDMAWLCNEYWSLVDSFTLDRGKRILWHESIY